MRDIVVHRSGCEIDLSAPSSTDERLLRWIRAEYGRTPRGELRCQAHGGDLYLVTRGSDKTMWAAHWPGTAAKYPRHSIALMTPEHRNEVEYMRRAADREGMSTATEFTVPGARLDLVVGGTTAFEAQHSGITVATVKGRTTKALRGGMHTATWISDKEQAPGWMGLVPAVRVFARDWQRLPDRGEATVVGGLVRLGRTRCSPPTTFTCLDNRQRRYCGQWHLTRGLLGGVTLDEITVGLAAGEYVPVRVREYAFIAEQHDAEKYGAPRWEPPAPSVRQMRTADRVECRSDRPVTESHCCKDPEGPLRLWCQLCPKSATYWRAA